MTLEGEAFRASGQAEAELVRGALAVRDRIRANGWIAGGLLGALFGGRLVALCVRRRREYYEIDRGTCFSCGRCFRYCPQEHIRLRGKPGARRPDGQE